MILKDDHENNLYLYTILEENNVNECPICHAHTELINCYSYIESEELTQADNLVVKYRKCENCNHIFADNRIDNEIYSQKIDDRDAYIFNAYDIEDKLVETSKLLVVSENELLSEVLSKDYDVEYIKGSFEKNHDLEKLIGEINKHSNRILITIVNNIDSDFEEDLTMPLWARPAVVNAYSKQSIKKLLKEKGISNVKIFNSKFLKGKMIVIAEI